jgi:hypothetical protein
MQSSIIGSSQASLFHGFHIRWVGVAHSGYIFGRGAVFHRYYPSGNHICSARFNNMNSQDFIGIFLPLLVLEITFSF